MRSVTNRDEPLPVPGRQSIELNPKKLNLFLGFEGIDDTPEVRCGRMPFSFAQLPTPRAEAPVQWT